MPRAEEIAAVPPTPAIAPAPEETSEQQFPIINGLDEQHTATPVFFFLFQKEGRQKDSDAVKWDPTYANAAFYFE